MGGKGCRAVCLGQSAGGITPTKASVPCVHAAQAHAQAPTLLRTRAHASLRLCGTPHTSADPPLPSPRPPALSTFQARARQWAGVARFWGAPAPSTAPRPLHRVGGKGWPTGACSGRARVRGVDGWGVFRGVRLLGWEGLAVGRCVWGNLRGASQAPKQAGLTRAIARP